MTDSEFLDWCESHQTYGVVLDRGQIMRLHFLAWGEHLKLSDRPLQRYYRASLGALVRHARQRITDQVTAKLAR